MAKKHKWTKEELDQIPDSRRPSPELVLKWMAGRYLTGHGHGGVKVYHQGAHGLYHSSGSGLWSPKSAKLVFDRLAEEGKLHRIKHEGGWYYTHPDELERPEVQKTIAEWTETAAAKEGFKDFWKSFLLPGDISRKYSKTIISLDDDQLIELMNLMRDGIRRRSVV